MPTKQFLSYNNIVVKGGSSYVKKVTGDLTKIHKMGSGVAFFQALNGTSHKLTIGPRDPVDYPSNYCEWGDDSVHTLLSQAIKAQDDLKFKTALSGALKRAERNGITRAFVASQLTVGLLPITYDTVQNVSRPRSRAIGADDPNGLNAMANQANQTMRSGGLLDELAAGTRPLSAIPRGWDRDLQRILRPYLHRGAGGACTIGFDPYQTYPCDADPARKNRPPAIGLVHEMVHAWRYMTGRRLHITGGGFDIEEVLATGFAPYNYEEFSENLFRSQFKSDDLIIRETYSYLRGTDQALRTSD
jgi:hypothetical protein